jgi:hypothetical protein
MLHKMNVNRLKTIVLLSLLLAGSGRAFSQITERERPAEWDGLVKGGRFMDRFLPMNGKTVSSDTWGVDGVIPRYIDNGIEDRIWSYWGGNIAKGDDGMYHLLVCGWLESSPKGHAEWPNSLVFNTVSDNPSGPFRLRNMIGKGHNPEVYRLKDDRWVLYVIDGRYVADDLNGRWEYGKFDFDPRDRRIIEGLSNLSFAGREDGSYVMVCRGGGIWISRDGLSEWDQVTDRSVYPAVEGEFEDPVIWRDHVQYHMIVNDWLGRIAYYLRSKDGVNWVVDPGEAYMPGIAAHDDGTVEDWFKFERIKMLQDEHGRAVQANFAVIDTLKPLDKPFDDHSSKNISIPLDPGLLLTMPDPAPVTPRTRTIRVRIEAEEGFNPQTDLDVASLRFGASSEVNYGRGSRVLETGNDGRDLIVTFDAAGSGITADEFAPKMLGRRADGRMVYGYARLPYIDHVEPILSARAPVFAAGGKGSAVTLEIQNFGQVASAAASVRIEYTGGGKTTTVASGAVPALAPYEKAEVSLRSAVALDHVGDGKSDMKVTISSGRKTLSTFEFGL